MTDLSIAIDREPQYLGEIRFAPAFEIRLIFEEMRSALTPHGERLMRKIVGGTVSGKIEGIVYPNGGGEYSLRRGDEVIDLHAHIAIRDTKGEWLYVRNIGYERPDGYARVTSWVDADVRSDHNWVLGLFFIGTIEPDGENAVIIRYAEVL